MLAESISLKIFVSSSENPQEISEKFLKIIPFDLGKESLVLERRKATGFNQDKILILELTLKKKKHTNAFLERFKTELSNEVKSELVLTLEERMDEDCNFFIRLSKPDLFINNRYELTKDGLCLHIKIHVATYPKRRENALQEMKDYLTSDEN